MRTDLAAIRATRDRFGTPEAFVAACQSYVIDVVKVAASPRRAKPAPPFAIYDRPFDRSGFEDPEADRWTELVTLAFEGKLTAELRWAALYADLGLSWSDPEDNARFMTDFVLALGAARHPERNEPALPFFAVQLPSAQTLDRGKRRAYEHWYVDSAIELEIERGSSIADACRSVFDALKDTELVCAGSAKSLEKAFLRRRRLRRGRPMKTPGFLRAAMKRHHLYNQVEGARRHLIETGGLAHFA